MTTLPSLDLDARQRAMLDEMGVKLWLPPPATQAATVRPTLEPAAPPLMRPEPPPARAPLTRPPAGTAPAPAAETPASALPALRITAPQRLYPRDGLAPTGGWLIVADMPPGADGRHGPPFEGDAGRLLDQMLRALRLRVADVPVHLLRAFRQGAGAPPASDEAADFDTAFTGWALPLAPRVVLAMGPLSAQHLLGRSEPLGRLRGEIHALPALGAGAQAISTYHPAYLLRNPADKARAWADLCLAATCCESVDAPSGAAPLL
jgi:uracil-DNA glycosylase family 4